jgi:hypothetical protein
LGVLCSIGWARDLCLEKQTSELKIETNFVKNFSERNTVFILVVLLGAFSIIGSSYVGLNGNHVFRQADAYAQILGFLGVKGIRPLSDFYGKIVIYDVPIYQFIVAKLSLVTFAHPLVVVKYLDLFYWVILLWFGGNISYQLGGSREIFWSLITTSPLLLHYFACPLPDVMATSCSVAAIFILINEKKYIGWVYTFSSAFLLFISALIKSPIPFVFIIFYSVHILISGYRNLYSLLTLRNIASYIAFSFAAVLAELIRKKILGTDVSGFAQDPSWYFGSIRQRISNDFWSMILDRVLEATAFHFIAYIGLIALIAYLFIRGAEAIKALMPFVAAFFSGWLVFSNVYFIHDYYEIPVTIMFFSAVSIAIKNIINYVEVKQWFNIRTRTDFTLVTGAGILFLCACPLLMVYGNKISDYQAESIWSSVRFALRDTDRLLWVGSGRDPGVGGLAKTVLKQIDKTVLEKNCEKILSDNEAVLVRGKSTCLSDHKNGATTYIEDDGLQLYVDRNYSYKKMLQRTLALNPLAESFYSLYHIENYLVYVRKNCAPADSEARFFLHLYREGKYKNLDFDFTGYGAVIESFCIAVRPVETNDLNTYDFDTGQYVGGKRLWQVNQTGLWSRLRSALRGSEIILLVGDGSGESFKKFISAPLITLDLSEVEKNCEKILSDNQAIIVVGRSACLSNHKSSATTYIEDGNFQIYINKKNFYEEMLQGTSNAKPLRDSYYSIYREKSYLIYVRKNCAPADSEARFFLHLYKDGEYKNLDFDFSENGAIIGSTCIAAKNIETGDTGSFKFETGQYRDENRFWEVDYVGESMR